MADNITLPGDGSDVATEDVGGKHHQRVIFETVVNGIPVDVSADSPLYVIDPNVRDLVCRIKAMLYSPAGYDKSLQRQRVTATVESGTVTTCATVTNLSTIDTLQGRIQVYGANYSAWSDCVRARIT